MVPVRFPISTVPADSPTAYSCAAARLTDTGPRLGGRGYQRFFYHPFWAALLLSLMVGGCEPLDDHVGTVVQASGSDEDPTSETAGDNLADRGEASTGVSAGELDTGTGADECDDWESISALGFSRSWLSVHSNCIIDVEIGDYRDFLSGGPIALEDRFFVELVIWRRQVLPAPPEDGVCPIGEEAKWWPELRWFPASKQFAHLCEETCRHAAQLVDQVVAYGCGDLSEVDPAVAAWLDNAIEAQAAAAAAATKDADGMDAAAKDADGMDTDGMDTDANGADPTDDGSITNASTDADAGVEDP